MLRMPPSPTEPRLEPGFGMFNSQVGYTRLALEKACTERPQKTKKGRHTAPFFILINQNLQAIAFFRFSSILSRKPPVESHF